MIRLEHFFDKIALLASKTGHLEEAKPIIFELYFLGGRHVRGTTQPGWLRRGVPRRNFINDFFSTEWARKAHVFLGWAVGGEQILPWSQPWTGKRGKAGSKKKDCLKIWNCSLALAEQQAREIFFFFFSQINARFGMLLKFDTPFWTFHELFWKSKSCHESHPKKRKLPSRSHPLEPPRVAAHPKPHRSHTHFAGCAAQPPPSQNFEK